MRDMQAKGQAPDILFWVGCAGSFDARAQKISIAFVSILHKAQINFAILGKEEKCTGDAARRAGNEFLFQMMAYNNIQVLNGYGVKKIVATCPHCYNTLKNEYPELGGNYEVMHHATFIEQLVQEGKIKLKDESIVSSIKATYHDSCYLGRANNLYDASRNLLQSLNSDVIEMGRCRSNGLCCGAGGAQMFKEEEHGTKRINTERTDEALETGATVVVTACPFCNTMISDGIKDRNKENEVQALDIAEIVAASME